MVKLHIFHPSPALPPAISFMWNEFHPFQISNRHHSSSPNQSPNAIGSSFLIFPESFSASLSLPYLHTFKAASFPTWNNATASLLSLFPAQIMSTRLMFLRRRSNHVPGLHGNFGPETGLLSIGCATRVDSVAPPQPSSSAPPAPISPHLCISCSSSWGHSFVHSSHY